MLTQPVGSVFSHFYRAFIIDVEEACMPVDKKRDIKFFSFPDFVFLFSRSIEFYDNRCKKKKEKYSNRTYNNRVY